MTYATGFFTDGGVKRTCLLDEGTVTVSTTYGIGGGSAKSYSFASEIKKGSVVVVSVDSGNTWANTGGNILVTTPANADDLVFGIVISEPEFTKKPATTAAADTLAERLSGKYLRAATVWFPGVTAITQATLNCANGANVVPGTLSILKLDQSACAAAPGIFVNDVANGGTINAVSLHYQAQDATSAVVVPIMLAFFGGKFIAAT